MSYPLITAAHLDGAPEPGRRFRFTEIVRRKLQERRYSRRTQEAYVHWIRRFIHFHGRQHPQNLGDSEVSAFLSSLPRSSGRLPRRRRSRPCQRSSSCTIACCNARWGNWTISFQFAARRRCRRSSPSARSLPERTIVALGRHLSRVREQFEDDMRREIRTTLLDGALSRKYPNADRDWRWRYVFPSPRTLLDEANVRRRHHLDATVLQPPCRPRLSVRG